MARAETSGTVVALESETVAQGHRLRTAAQAAPALACRCFLYQPVGHVPNIVNTYIGLFKDTTLVVIVGIFDFLHTVEVSRIDPKWAAPTTSATGYVFAAIFYFTFCFAMSRYAKSVEARLAKGDRH